MEKCTSSIQCWESNSQPLERESPPITTRPGLLFFGPEGIRSYLTYRHLANITYVPMQVLVNLSTPTSK